MAAQIAALTPEPSGSAKYKSSISSCSVLKINLSVTVRLPSFIIDADNIKYHSTFPQGDNRIKTHVVTYCTIVSLEKIDCARHLVVLLSVHVWLRLDETY